MLPEKLCEQNANKHLQNYVNECKCNSRNEAALALQKMIAVAVHALDLVNNGQMDTVQ